MTIYRMTNDAIEAIKETTFSEVDVSERGDLQRLLREQIEIISPDTLLISEEFSDWESSKRRVDLLGIDRDANLVVIELKRTQDGGHMELQAIRYAAMVSTLDFESCVLAYEKFLTSEGSQADARSKILTHLGWELSKEDEFAQDVRIVLASAEFSLEITTTVLWLNERGLDIRCVRIKPYGHRDDLLLDVQEIIPLPEAGQYITKLKKKQQKEREARRADRDYTRFDVTVGSRVHTNQLKRTAIFKVISALCESGINPADIAKVISWRNPLFLEVEGKVDSQEFQIGASQQKADFNASRWCCEDKELFHSEGKTYALTSQWGQRTERAMKALVDHFQPTNISFKRTATRTPHGVVADYEVENWEGATAPDPDHPFHKDGEVEFADADGDPIDLSP